MKRKITRDKIDVIHQAMNEVNDRCCDMCMSKQNNICEGITIHDDHHVTGCPKALAMHTEIYNKLTDCTNTN